MQKSIETALATEFKWITFLEAPLFEKRRFFNDFWAPAEAQNQLQNGPLDSKLGLGWPREVPGSPKGQFQSIFFIILKVMLGAQMAILGLYWDVLDLNGSKQQ